MKNKKILLLFSFIFLVLIVTGGVIVFLLTRQTNELIGKWKAETNGAEVTLEVSENKLGYTYKEEIEGKGIEIKVDLDYKITSQNGLQYSVEVSNPEVNISGEAVSSEPVSTIDEMKTSLKDQFESESGNKADFVLSQDKKQVTQTGKQSNNSQVFNRI